MVVNVKENIIIPASDCSHYIYYVEAHHTQSTVLYIVYCVQHNNKNIKKTEDV